MHAQTQSFRENGKWGMKEGQTILIKAAYDTIFGFDSTSRVCMACFKTKTASASKFIKMTTTSYACNYLNKKGEHLSIRNTANDTFSVFSLGKNSARQYQANNNTFVAVVKNKKYLIGKDFRQLTFKGYYDIAFTSEKKFYVTQTLNEWDVVVTGLVDQEEREVIPYAYSNIKVNPNDSLIIACSAGIGSAGEDDIFDYEGKKKTSSRRHIDMATKNFLIHKIFEPKEYYIIYNLTSKEEKQLSADEVKFYDHDNVLVRIKNDWFIYELSTQQKKPYKSS